MIQEKERMAQNVSYVLNVQNIVLKKHSNINMNKFNKKVIFLLNCGIVETNEKVVADYYKRKTRCGNLVFNYSFSLLEAMYSSMVSSG